MKVKNWVIKNPSPWGNTILGFQLHICNGTHLTIVILLHGALYAQLLTHLEDILCIFLNHQIKIIKELNHNSTIFQWTLLKPLDALEVLNPTFVLFPWSVACSNV